MLNKYDSTFNKKHGFIIIKRNGRKNSLVQLKIKRLKLGGSVPLLLKSQSSWKFENKAIES